ncbi:MAG: exosortase-associated protein EpsI, B-type [Pseudomonadota bacterium]
MSSSLRVSVWLAGLMLLAAVAGLAIRLSPASPDKRPAFALAEIVPRQFADWREQVASQAEVVNPQAQQLLDKLYSQTLTRVYVNSKGQKIMLSLAYGDDQRGELQAHKPEVCYPAQGFNVLTNEATVLDTPYGPIQGRRLETRQGARREPVSYWFTFGNTAVGGKFERRLVEIRLGLTGQVPDGLLFRVSSIDPVSRRAFQLHEEFVSAMLSAATPEARLRLSGLGALETDRP